MDNDETNGDGHGRKSHCPLIDVGLTTDIYEADLLLQTSCVMRYTHGTVHLSNTRPVLCSPFMNIYQLRLFDAEGLLSEIGSQDSPSIRR